MMLQSNVCLFMFDEFRVSVKGFFVDMLKGVGVYKLLVSHIWMLSNINGNIIHEELIGWKVTRAFDGSQVFQ